MAINESVLIDTGPFVAFMNRADAALLALAEREIITTIFTTDRRDFRVYRRRDGTPFRLLPDDYSA